MIQYSSGRAGFGPLLFLALLMASTGPASAQGSIGPSGDVVQRPAIGAYTVVALRVEFQPDDNRFTTGDGTFAHDLFGGLPVSIDPLPHDADYFEAHLQFLRHYVRHASGGRTELTTYLVPEVVRVSQPMASYSPIGEDITAGRELQKLVDLAHEAWSLADGLPLEVPPLDPERTFFLLFHAGAGRDIELIGTSLDKTPEDLPSLFLERKLFEIEVRAPLRYAGVDVRHTAVAPRTESRLGTNPFTGEPYVLEIGINGLVASLFLSYLGVPDLFDTETGESAMGPFGIMDPLGIFGCSGLLPPMPSAWERHFLGWIDIIHPPAGDDPQLINLKAQREGQVAQALRVPVSESEYFLVENRQRDPDDDGLTLHVRSGGQTHAVHFEREEDAFCSPDVSNFPGGVLVAADDYDWAMPSAKGDDGVRFDGGILIWHVDEGRIAETLPDNRVNADPRRRGVDLEEADGAQDVGYRPGNPFAPRLDLGTPFDFWFEDNPAAAIVESGRVVRLYQNRFGPDTQPSSDSNAGGPSHVVLEDFSASGPEMTLVYRRTLDGPTAPAGDLEGAFPQLAPLPVGSVIRSVSIGEEPRALLFTPGAPHAGSSHSGTAVFLSRPEQPVQGLASAIPAALSNGRVVVLGRSITGAPGLVFRFLDAQQDASPAEAPLPAALEQTRTVSHISALIDEGEERAFVLVRDPLGIVYAVRWRPDGPIDFQTAPAGSNWFGIAGGGAEALLFALNGGYTWTGERRFDFTIDAADQPGQVLVVATSTRIAAIPLVGSRQILMVHENGRVDRHPLPVEDGDLLPFVIPVDLDQNGRIDYLVAAGSYLVGLTEAGALISGFPLRLPAPIAAQPLVVQPDKNGGWTLLVPLNNGTIHAVGAPLAGFPLSAGAGLNASPLLINESLLAVTKSGNLRAWRLPEIDHVAWPEAYGGPANSGFLQTSAPAEPGTGSVLIREETYAWPNPSRDGESVLRVGCARACNVDIRVVDLAGRLVGTFRMEDMTAQDIREIRWTHGLQSGLYYARVRAEASDQSQDSHLVKIAVIQ